MQKKKNLTSKEKQDISKVIKWWEYNIGNCKKIKTEVRVKKKYEEEQKKRKL